ncbi:MAG: helix-turn-helix transcriptional regulator [Cellulosilyticaceae bacterium]
MLVSTLSDFQQFFLHHLSFLGYSRGDSVIYHNKKKPELGFFIKYSRPGYYDFDIGDYTIPEDFSLTFSHQETLLRLGTIYTGKATFTSSSFFIVENNWEGKQHWQKGQHFHGAEITIHKRYIDEWLCPHFPSAIDLEHFITNHTYPYLPIQVARIIQELANLGEMGRLTPLYLESKLLEIISHLALEEANAQESVLTPPAYYSDIKIGHNRFLTLTSSDILAIQKAHSILTKEACNPPTIASLSKRVFLNEQKLKAGFAAKYHLSIGQYSHSIRMNIAEDLLLRSDLSIEQIGKKIGYNHCSNFIKMFKQTHGKTPLAFRKQKNN